MSDAIPATPNSRPKEIEIRRLLVAAPASAAAAVVGNVLLYYLAVASNALNSVNLLPPPAPAEKLPVLPVILSSAIPAFLAAAVLALLAKFTPSKAVMIFEVMALVLVLASFAGPLMLPESTTMASKIVLCAMHVVAGAAIVGTLVELSTRRG